MADLAREVGGLPVGYVSEVCTASPAWTETLGARLARGVVLLADYGYPGAEYYHPQRSSGTLRCYYRHHAIDDPFHLPGLTDITAWVDFTAVADTAYHSGFAVSGYTTQASFLMDCGLMSLLQEASPDQLADQLQQSEAAKQLLMPGEMGENVKVIMLGKDSAEPLLGFGRDMRYQL